MTQAYLACIAAAALSAAASGALAAEESERWDSGATVWARTGADRAIDRARDAADGARATRDGRSSYRYRGYRAYGDRRDEPWRGGSWPDNRRWRSDGWGGSGWGGNGWSNDRRFERRDGPAYDRWLDDERYRR